jgi:endonuclease
MGTGSSLHSPRISYTAFMILESPAKEALEDLLRLAIVRREFAQVIGPCEVVYVGRAASLTESGEYVVMLKPDGSLQVHGARGVKPINWQPKTDDLRVTRDEDDRVMLLAERFNPNELVQITFNQPRMALSLELRDEKIFQLHGSEAQMHEALKRDLSILEPGLRLLEHELPVGVGDVDIYARDARGNLVVIEVKRGKANQEGVHQLCRYVDAVRLQLPPLFAPGVRGILAAPDISKPARKQLEGLGLEFREFKALPEEQPVMAQVGLFAAVV